MLEMKCNILTLLPLMHWEICAKREIRSAMNFDSFNTCLKERFCWDLDFGSNCCVNIAALYAFPLISSCSIIAVSLWSAAFPLSANAGCFPCNRNAEFRIRASKANQKKCLHTNGSEISELFFFGTEVFRAIALLWMFCLLVFEQRK